MLVVDGLIKEYKDFRAVDNLSFSVKSGEILGVLGPNGAGKTTALRCIAGILRPTSGRIEIAGHDTIRDMANAKRSLAFVPEVPSLYELMTVWEHLKFVAMAFNSMPIFERDAETLLSRYSLWEKKDDLVATLSKGQRQKLSVACALVHDAKVMLFDEPLIGIDPAGARELKNELMNSRNNGASILISTHLLDTAERLCDRVMIVARGKLLAQGTLAELQHTFGMEGRTLEDVFLSLTGDAPAPSVTPGEPPAMPPQNDPPQGEPPATPPVPPIGGSSL